uniref:Uncharacterized protein n=1 Tax=Lactuca sativa TaxID=4236 RepID=A0A9R1VTH7_LACSA|nr:hypothetical protein LSAT_V11C400174970 [Lactuca sativa]
MTINVIFIFHSGLLQFLTWKDFLRMILEEDLRKEHGGNDSLMATLLQHGVFHINGYATHNGFVYVSLYFQTNITTPFGYYYLHNVILTKHVCHINKEK